MINLCSFPSKLTTRKDNIGMERITRKENSLPQEAFSVPERNSFYSWLKKLFMDSLLELLETVLWPESFYYVWFNTTRKSHSGNHNSQSSNLEISRTAVWRTLMINIRILNLIVVYVGVQGGRKAMGLF